jgi:endonuclease/exonuclease/phosphatase (EEP) superfamily protein YafD
MGALIIPSALPPVRAASAHVGTGGEPYLPGLDQSFQLDRLVGDAERNEPITLMMGDYNVLPEDPRMAPRMEALGYRDAGGSVAGRPCGATPGCTPTFPSGGVFGAPSAKVDYIYYRGLVALHHEVVEPLVGGVEASDHRAIVVDFAGVPVGPPLSA